MRYGLRELFSLLDDKDPCPCICGENITIGEPLSGELFPDATAAAELIPYCGKSRYLSRKDTDIITGLYSAEGIDFSGLPNSAARLFRLSVNAFDAFVHMWMSEVPLESELLRFGRKIITAGGSGSDSHAEKRPADTDRRVAELAASNLSDSDVRLVLDTAYKVRHEIDRFRGLLRFIPNTGGGYIARCEPDYFILPALGDHFTRRFGNTSWVIVDGKRGICLVRPDGNAPELVSLSSAFAQNCIGSVAADPWEDLWKKYHRTVHNESRKNPQLQRQFMPQRYWKNLPEMESGE